MAGYASHRPDVRWRPRALRRSFARRHRLNDIAVPANAGLGVLPLLFPEAAVFDPRYLRYQRLTRC